MAKLVHSTQSFMNVEDAIITKKRKRAEWMKVELPRHPEQGPHPKKARMREKTDRDNRKASSSLGRNLHYMPLNALLDQVLMQIKNDPSIKWPEKMKGDPNKRNKNKYCHFHRDHKHDMDECLVQNDVGAPLPSALLSSSSWQWSHFLHSWNFGAEWTSSAIVCGSWS